MYKKQARNEFINIHNELEKAITSLVKIKSSLKTLEKLGYNHDYEGVVYEINKNITSLNDIKDYNKIKFKQQF